MPRAGRREASAFANARARPKRPGLRTSRRRGRGAASVRFPAPRSPRACPAGAVTQKLGRIALREGEPMPRPNSPKPNLSRSNLSSSTKTGTARLRRKSRAGVKQNAGRNAEHDPLRGDFGEDVQVPTDPEAYRQFEAAVLGVVPGRGLARDMTTAQRHYQLRFWAGHDAHRRMTNTLFGFYDVCGHAVCRRAKSCAENPHACFLAIWPHVDPESKAWLRGFIPARANGASKEEALKQADASIAAHRSALEGQERWTARADRQAAEPAAPDTPPRDRATVRVRSL